MVAKGQKMLADAWADLHLAPSSVASGDLINVDVEVIPMVEETEVVDNGKTPKRKRAKITDPAEKEMNAKRRTTGYLLFCQEARHESGLEEQCPDKKQLMAFIADKWKNLDAEHRKVFEERAEKIRNDAKQSSLPVIAEEPQVQQQPKTPAPPAATAVATPMSLDKPAAPKPVEAVAAAAPSTPLQSAVAEEGAANEEAKKAKKEKKHKHDSEKKKHKKDKKKSLGGDLQQPVINA